MAKKIKELSTTGPVLVYGIESLSEALKVASIEPIIVDENVDADQLRKLEERDGEQFKVVLASTPFGMRGIDYRANGVTMTLVIAKAFAHTREAM